MDSTVSYVIATAGKAAPKELPIDPQKFNDVFYRYKMRQLIVQIVGKGKMIKTTMLNLNDVATDLKVPADYIPHFLAKNIGATAHYDEKKPERERGSISGSHSCQELSDWLKKFVKCFVMCPNCGYPEFQYNPVGTAGKSAESGAPGAKNIKVKCMSCGWKSDVKAMELNDKFRRYILNHPPPKPVAMIKPVVEKSSKTAKDGNKSASSDGWATDTSKEAVKQRMEKMVPQNLQALVAAAEGNDMTFSQILKNYMSTGPHKPEEVVNEVARITSQGGLDAEKRTQMIVDGLFSDLKTFGVEMVKNKAVVEKWVTEVKGQQVLFLAGIEALYEKEEDVERRRRLRIS